MRILIDINHPAHVHYSKNFIFNRLKKGDKILVLARQKEVVERLLQIYSIDFVTKGKGSDQVLGKIIYLIRSLILMTRKAIKFRPEIFVSYGSVNASIVSRFVGCPHLTIDDTEHSVIDHSVYRHFTDIILTPSVFKKSLGKNHYKLKFTTDSLYLSPKYFNPDRRVLKILGLEENEPFIVYRIVAWGAFHDRGHTIKKQDDIRFLLTELNKICKVYISSELPLSADFPGIVLSTQSEQIHSVMYFAKLMIGDSGTMCSESSYLGTPSINTSSTAKLNSVFEYFSEMGLMYLIEENHKIIVKAKQLIDQQIEEPSFYKQKANTLQGSFVEINELLSELVDINEPKAMKKHLEEKWS